MVQEEQAIEAQAEFFKLLGNPRRLRILASVSEDERCVSDIADSLHLPSQVVSQNLRVLKDRGAVVARKAGRRVFYRCANPKFCQAARLIREALAEEVRKQVGE